jgi:hypothetical protein
LPGGGELSSKSQSLSLGKRIKGHRKENMCHAKSLLKKDNEELNYTVSLSFKFFLLISEFNLLHGLVR